MSSPVALAEFTSTETTSPLTNETETDCSVVHVVPAEEVSVAVAAETPFLIIPTTTVPEAEQLPMVMATVESVTDDLTL
jgi:hypothetical protein